MIYHCPICGKWCENYSQDYRNQMEMYRVKELTIIDEWNAVPIPPAPELKSVTIDPETSALLILDMETTICKNPRCTASISKISKILNKAREMGMLVIYSLTHAGSPSDIALQIAPSPSDPVVKSNVDKFYRTNLEKILQEHGIKTVLITGYAANGAVLHTATSAAFRGYDVIIPVDGMSAVVPYAEQYTAWHMINSPGTRNRATLTKVDLINFLPLETSYRHGIMNIHRNKQHKKVQGLSQKVNRS
ncbi:Nicotinamidase-related amidase [Paenibacillus sp. 1_12]|uniref:cysteine hydrolase n=1 Tax=Paenibacillus sp. 1_12 TaxID=1566278 RepID=UPI0008EAB1C6|nr:cysteine hydrolase [Paenibacillus sp. 1_12]SFL07137.1 Nicotinamidase-related amidase [Paenibacillus sp. 1_12]